MSPRDDVSRPEESLAFALRAIACQTGFEIEHNKLIAALGFGTPAVPSPIASSIMFGRDARLIEAGKLVGMQIRDVHPPEAARGLEAAAEFDQHFHAAIDRSFFEHWKTIKASSHGAAGQASGSSPGDGFAPRATKVLAFAERRSGRSGNSTRYAMTCWSAQRCNSISSNASADDDEHCGFGSIDLVLGNR